MGFFMNPFFYIELFLFTLRKSSDFMIIAAFLIFIIHNILHRFG